MSLSVVQTVPTLLSAGTTTVISISGVTTGNLLVLGFVGFAGTPNPHVISVIDGVNTYSQVSGAQVTLADGGVADIWYAANVTGGSLTITATFDSSMIADDAFIITSEIRGAATSTPLYAGANIDHTSSSGQFVGPNTNLVNANDMAIAYGYWNDTNNIIGANGWTNFQLTYVNNTTDGYYTPGTAGVTSMSVTPTSSAIFFSTGAAISAQVNPLSATSMFLVF